MEYALGFLFVFMSICAGSLVWNERAFQLYRERIHEPWGESIERHDWSTCDKFEFCAENFPLQSWKYMFNPLAWLLNWNWKPKID